MREVIRRAGVAGALALMAALAAPALADASYSYQYVTDAPAYSAPAGGSVTVSVYLQETVSGGTGSLIASDGGLAGAGFAVATVTPAPADPAQLTGIAGSALFSGGFVASPGNSAALMSGDNVAFLGTKPTPDADGRVLLGTVTITPGSAGSTTFTVGAVDPVFGGYTQTGGTGMYDLDLNHTATTPIYTAAGSSTFTVSTAAVPEPASLGLLALGGLALLRRRR